MSFTKNLASLSKLRLLRGRRANPNRKLRAGAWAFLAVLGGAAGYWAYTAIVRSKQRKGSKSLETGKSKAPFGEAKMQAVELEKRWHSLDQDESHGHISRDLAREPKDI